MVPILLIYIVINHLQIHANILWFILKQKKKQHLCIKLTLTAGCHLGRADSLAKHP